jgi:glutathione S-transferase
LLSSVRPPVLGARVAHLWRNRLSATGGVGTRLIAAMDSFTFVAMLGLGVFIHDVIEIAILVALAAIAVHRLLHPLPNQRTAEVRFPFEQRVERMILYGSSLSPYVRKVLAFAGEKEIEIELRPTGFPNLSAEFLEASPFKKMPAFRDGEYTLADSSAIIQYLEAKQPAPALIPDEAKLRGNAIWFEEFADTILVACGAKIFFNRIVAPRFMGRPCDEEAVRAAERDELPPVLNYLETVVPADGGYLVGDRLTIADIAVASPFANFRHTNTHIDPDRYPRTVAYVERIMARPSIARWIERETEMLSREAA